MIDFHTSLPTNGHPIPGFRDAFVLEYNLHMASLERQIEGLAEVVIGAVGLEEPRLDDAGGQHIVGVPRVTRKD